MAVKPPAPLSDIDVLCALVHRDGETRTAAAIGTSEASVYRWVRQGAAPQLHRLVQALRVQGATLSPADIQAWRQAKRAGAA